MELIRKTKVTTTKKGNKIRWGEFLCLFCLTIVEKQIENGKILQSCGCVKNVLISKALKGKPSPNKGKSMLEKQKQKISKARKGYKPSEETKQKIKDNNARYWLGKLGELNPNWQGGKSFEIYPQEFKQIRKTILERDNYTCQDPNCDGNHKKLHTHHIDYDKKNNNLENLITLCSSCHTKTNGKNKRQYFTAFYKNIMMYRIIDYFL